MPLDTPKPTGLEQGTVQPQKSSEMLLGMRDTVEMTHWVPCGRWGGEPCPGPKNTKWAGQEDNHVLIWGGGVMSC